MKTALLALGLIFSNFVFALELPPNIGNFQGLAFSSATIRQPVEIQGGNLVNCEARTNSGNEIHTCLVENGSLVVSGTELTALTVKFSKVTVLRTTGKTPTRHYYIGGTADLKYGGKVVPTVVKVTLSFYDSAPDHVSGFVDLIEQGVRTAVDGYRVDR